MHRAIVNIEECYIQDDLKNDCDGYEIHVWLFEDKKFEIFFARFEKRQWILMLQSECWGKFGDLGQVFIRVLHGEMK